MKITFEKQKLNDKEIIVAYLYEHKKDKDPLYNCASEVPKDIDEFIDVVNASISSLMRIYTNSLHDVKDV